MLVSVTIAGVELPLPLEVAVGSAAKLVQRPPLLRFVITAVSVIEKASRAEVLVAVDSG
ncbi:hypothetical protein AHAS_Ahas09G0178100 [Arachis hypogaea]